MQYSNAMHMNKIIGQLIKEKRKAKGMTQVDLGACMNVYFQSISDYESGRRMPSIEWILRCCKCLDIEPGDFMSELSKRIK